MLEDFALCFAGFDGHVSNHWATHADPNRNDLPLLHLHKRRFDTSTKSASPPIHSVAAQPKITTPSTPTNPPPQPAPNPAPFCPARAVTSSPKEKSRKADGHATTSTTRVVEIETTTVRHVTIDNTHHNKNRHVP